MAANISNLIRGLAHDARPNYLEAIDRTGELVENNGINTPLRIAHFFAQALTETGAFVLLRESMNYSAERLVEIFGVNRHSAAITEAEAQELAHDEQRIAERVYGLGNPHKAHELGNTQQGDGFRYRGNGVLQMTGRGAHRHHGQACGVDFENKPELVTAPEHALKPAVQEWSEGNLNEAADRDDIRSITLKINGGFNGFDDRVAWLGKLKKALIATGELPPDAMLAAAADDVHALQVDLNRLGANPRVEEDGRLGPLSMAAVKAFQIAAGLEADGIAGPITLAAINQRLSTRR